MDRFAATRIRLLRQRLRHPARRQEDPDIPNEAVLPGRTQQLPEHRAMRGLQSGSQLLERLRLLPELRGVAVRDRRLLNSRRQSAQSPLHEVQQRQLVRFG